MSDTPRILALAGSLRRDSHNKKVVRIAAEGARKAGAEVTFLDFKEFPLPIYDADQHEAEGFHPNAARLQEILLAHDGLLVSSPEYNGSLPAVLKNAFDWASRANGDLKLGAAFAGKVAAIMSSSPGSFGGIRCLGHLRDVLSILGCHVLPHEFAISSVHQNIDENGVHRDEKMHKTLEQHGANVAETIKKLRA